MKLKAADVGGHNVSWQVETLAHDPEENQRLQSEFLRTQEQVQITLYDAGRWAVQVSKNFPSQKNLKGFWGMIAKFPALSQWFSRAAREHRLESLARLVLHRLGVSSPAHWEGCKDSNIVQ